MSVTVIFKVVSAIPTTSYLVLASNLPKPFYAIRLTETSDNGQDNVCRLQVEKDGRFQIIDCITGNGYYKFTFTYIAAD